MNPTTSQVIAKSAALLKSIGVEATLAAIRVTENLLHNLEEKLGGDEGTPACAHPEPLKLDQKEFEFQGFLKIIRAKVQRGELDLDERIHDMKAEEAASINNAGTETQLRYLVDMWGMPDAQEVLLADE